MKVHELISELQQCDGDRLVVICPRPVVNHGTSPVDGVDGECVYVERYTRTYMETLTEELRKQGYTEDDLAPRDATSVPAVCLFPRD